MRIIKPSVTLLSHTPNPESLIEQAGRICYKSDRVKCPDCGNVIEDQCVTCHNAGYIDQDYLTDPDPESAAKFVGKITKLGHHSVIEHASATLKIVCDRGVTHELVRHRLASYSQESTRYCNYSKGEFGSEITVIAPPFADSFGGTSQKAKWESAMGYAERMYFGMLEQGAPPQIARSVLPNSLKAEIVMTANIREWMHVLTLRLAPAAHPQMREIARMILDALKPVFPTILAQFVNAE
ncbi:MAG: FAD-dependent thymidylate synthase [bacterium]|nr:FAD-dependent thymidylate synthase [bacterium]